MKNVLTHTLLNGATIVSLSKHEFRFSDGTVAPAQTDEVVDNFNLERKFTFVKEINGLKVNQTTMVLSDDQVQDLTTISKMADIVILPFPVLCALREQGIRDDHRNCVAFNATQDTMRSGPSEKVVDIDNFSY